MADKRLKTSPVAIIALLSQHLPNDALDRLGNVVDVLGLDDCLDRVLEHACEKVLKLRTPEVGQDLRPVGRVAELAQIGLQFARKDLSVTEARKFSED